MILRALLDPVHFQRSKDAASGEIGFRIKTVSEDQKPNLRKSAVKFFRGFFAFFAIFCGYLVFSVLSLREIFFGSCHSACQLRSKPYMKAIVRKQFGGPEVLEVRELIDPKPKPGHVLIEVKAFGVNHAETHMRKGEWPEIAEVSGIECVGTVKADPDGRLGVGQKVVALMGGMGRTINGSYAEYTNVPGTNVVPIQTDLFWEAVAAIP